MSKPPLSTALTSDRSSTTMRESSGEVTALRSLNAGFATHDPAFAFDNCELADRFNAQPQHLHAPGQCLLLF